MKYLEHFYQLNIFLIPIFNDFLHHIGELTFFLNQIYASEYKLRFARYFPTSSILCFFYNVLLLFFITLVIFAFLYHLSDIYFWETLAIFLYFVRNATFLYLYFPS